MSKGRTLLKNMGQILSGLWKLVLMALYATSKLIENLAGMLAKITEKYID